MRRGRRNARASRARTRGRRCGEGALCAIAGQAPSARVLELRVHLPAVASMLQINIHAATTTLALCSDPDGEGWRRKQLAAKLPIPLPGACDPGAVREHCAARARTLCALLSLQSAPTGPLHTTLPTRLFASPPRDATPEGLCCALSFDSPEDMPCSSGCCAADAKCHLCKPPASAPIDLLSTPAACSGFFDLDTCASYGAGARCKCVRECVCLCVCDCVCSMP